MRTITAFAPATVGNMGPGFDLLGLALDGLGDRVTATRCEAAGVHIEAVEGTDRLPLEADRNTAGVAATLVLARAASKQGVSLVLHKGLPLGSGLGSSGASAVAAAVAVNELLGRPLGLPELFAACRAAEGVACGSPHPDNVAPALWGGIVLCLPREGEPGRDGLSPVEVVPLPVPEGLRCAVVHPDIEVRTQAARAVLPKALPLPDAIFYAGQVAATVAALCRGDLELLRRAAVDRVAEPHRAGLGRGMVEALKAGRETGAVSVGISGSGPTLFALAADAGGAAAAAAAMQEAFASEGVASSWSAHAPGPGARVVEPR